MNCAATPPLGSTNCGRNARKNAAVFGFSASTAMPSRSALPRPRPAPSRDAEPEKIDGAGEFQNGEALRARHHKGRHPGRTGEHMNEAAQRGAEDRGEALAAAARESPRGDIENAGTGRAGDQQGRCQKKQQCPAIRHA
jgi:hypothetical protein